MKHIAGRAALIVATLFIAFGWLPHATAISNETFGVTPSPEHLDGVDRTTFSIPLETGATFEDAVRIYNRTDQQVTLVVYAADAEDTNGAIAVQGFRGTQPKGVGAWIDLSREDVELAPRASAIVSFRVNVKTGSPSPNYGAIVVENTANSGLSNRSVDRLDLVVRTVPPNTATTSRRVRSLLLRSPWIIIAMIGLIVVAVLIWVGARRSRRPGDVVVPAGELDRGEPDASAPVITRLGEPGDDDITRASRHSRGSRGSRKRDERPLLGNVLADVTDDHPVVDDDYSLDEDEELAALTSDDDYDDLEDDLPPAPKRKPAAKRKPAPKRKPPAKRKPAAKKPVARKSTAKKPSARKAAPKGQPRRKGGYIPLDDL